ncbi:MAG TPA: MFS transporter, partial [Thermoanaerobaculia bacterium]
MNPPVSAPGCHPELRRSPPLSDHTRSMTETAGAIARDGARASRPTASRREIFGWAMFDFANSSYTTVIVTVVFSIIFPRLIIGDAPEFRRGNLMWSLALSISYALVVVSLPILGAIMDFSAAKKKFLFASYLTTVVATAALWFVHPGDVVLGIILIVVSNYGFSAGEGFVASFLPDLAPPEQMGKVSGFAWGLGYFGGLASTAIVLFGLGALTLENFPRLRFVGPITAAFFLLAAIPTFLFLRERGTPRALPPGETYVTIGFRRLGRTMREMRDFRDFVSFLVSFFFAMAGLINVISFAFIFGDQVIQWSRSTQTLMFVVTQLTAAVGAVLFGIVQDRIGDKKTFGITLLLWVASVTLIYATKELTASLNAALGTSWSVDGVFLVLGGFAGLSIGATQSASRALVGVLAPSTKAGEFFAFWAVSSRVASIFGLVSLGVLQAAFGLHRAILVSALFFLIA